MARTTGHAREGRARDSLEISEEGLKYTVEARTRFREQAGGEGDSPRAPRLHCTSDRGCDKLKSLLATGMCRMLMHLLLRKRTRFPNAVVRLVLQTRNH